MLELLVFLKYLIDHSGVTPLHMAAKYNHLESVQFLLYYLAKPYIKNKFDKLPIDYCTDDLIRGILRRANLIHKNSGFFINPIPVTETLNKFESMKSIIINAFEAIDYVQTNDMSTMLSRVKGAEKLIEALKGGYNDSLRELLFEKAKNG